MKHVRIEPDEFGFSLDPQPYLEVLPGLAGGMPAGAREFATEPGHYDFSKSRCVKDLALEGIEFGESDSLTLRFRHNCWKHEEDLIIGYIGVTDYHVSVELDGGRSRLLFDEVLPDSGGCRHELVFRDGTIAITCGDLVATWIDAECPDK
ncbi:hypothetical protein [Nonomuraea dietziae]|uniref:hypothetical protein n=1 Tax=Nonomuraea dietziae TaxID=65515 RepID=UPI0033D17A8A